MSSNFKIFMFLISLVSFNTNATLILNPDFTINDYVSLGEWNSNTNTEGWQSRQAINFQATSGTLSGEVQDRANDPMLIRRGLTGIDLSSGDFDIVEIGLRLNGAVSRLDFFWGTSNAGGFRGTRRFGTESIALPTDEQSFVLQFDMSSILSWDGILTDVRLDPFTGNISNSSSVSRSYEVDYVRVGAVPVPEPGTLGLFGLSLLLARCLAKVRRDSAFD